MDYLYPAAMFLTLVVYIAVLFLYKRSKPALGWLRKNLAAHVGRIGAHALLGFVLCGLLALPFLAASVGVGQVLLIESWLGISMLVFRFGLVGAFGFSMAALVVRDYNLGE